MDIAARLEHFFAARDLAGVAGVYLFGSVASGRAHRESDVDVAVVFDRSLLLSARNRAKATQLLAGDLMAVLSTNQIDVVSLNDAPPLFARHIVLSGTRVFVRDSEALHAFVRDVLLRAADIEPFVERGRRRLLEELRR